MRLTLFACVVLVLCAASSVGAQSTDPYYSTFSANVDVVYHELGETSPTGAHFDVASTIKRDVPFLSILGEVGVNHFEGANVSSFLGGARLRAPNAAPRVLPFGQFLVGLYHCGACAINAFAIQGGGGVDVKLPNTSAVRIRGQVDVRHVFDEFSGFNGVRLSGGVVIPLNR